MGRPQSSVSPMPATPRRPGMYARTRCPPNQAMFGERRMRCPEALGASHALAGVLEHAGHRVAILQEMVAVCVFRSPTPVLPPLPVT